jgi:ElaB/YqjD/DUF883 family membrane-anchored ribosome-binding protein
MVSVHIQAQSTQMAKACLSAVIAELSLNQDAIAKPILENKKQKLNQLSEQLKISEKLREILTPLRINNNLTDTQSTVSLLLIILRKTSATEINDLRSQISSLKFDLIEPKTSPTSLSSSVYSSEASVNKRPLFTLGLCLVLGVFLGLLITGVMRFVPKILLHLRGYEGGAR